MPKFHADQIAFVKMSPFNGLKKSATMSPGGNSYLIALARSEASGSRLTYESGRGSLWPECMRVWGMRTGISITLKPADRRRLKALARDRNTLHKHVWRAEIVLF